MKLLNPEPLIQNNHHLVVIAHGKSDVGLLESIAKACKSSGCNIGESKLTTIANESSLMLSLTGTWNAVAKLEAALPALAQQVGFTFEAKRTLPDESFPATLPYQVQVFAQDRPGIINELTQFFNQNQIQIDAMDCETFATKNKTMMANLNFYVLIPAKHHLANLRERFMVYCEDRNLDVVFEPHKPN